MAEAATPHLLVIPFPAHGHMLPLLDLCHLLSTRHGLTITIVVTPGNLPTLSPILSSSPSISPLILPFPSSPYIPTGVENTYQVPPNLIRNFIPALSGLLYPILQWFHSHPNPPVAILSDFFTSAWTFRLAQSLSIPRLSFSPSGAFGIATIHQLWREMPSNSDPNLLIPFPSLPNSPSFPLSQLSTLFRDYIKGDSVSESIKENFLLDIQSWGFVVNTFSDLEGDYIEQLKKDIAAGHRRIWAVGPLVASPVERKTDAVIKEKVLTWLDGFPEGSVVYVCFGSQVVPPPQQAAAISAALELSGLRFLWCVREGTEVPAGFEERVAARGFVVKGWAPQVEILGHAAVGWFLTHCGWNSVIEAVVAGVALLTWPHGADQFIDARLLEDAGMAVRVAEGRSTVPEAQELARILAAAVGGRNSRVRERAAEISEMAKKAVAEGGSSFRDLHSLVAELKKMTVANEQSYAELPAFKNLI
ncbi:flavonol 3-O-glucosyltransferase UGT89B1 [Dendrobium catenatum]|uniref:UDP-glycosyltransferase 89B1 n=1 Tax=Dendrobium catenatum TaxID=906689 RepID=A0A2I0XC94_9ASPA|nr:flavonol 3-O-glucosyltransferase UGT89B1 [Dendrobium catenatum]PKU85504.1 UDP-glycosyltransferase 89B1 [Dendrobium catenatum]